MGRPSGKEIVILAPNKELDYKGEGETKTPFLEPLQGGPGMSESDQFWES